MQTEKLIPVTIDRNRWLRGSVAHARLRNPLSGHECCVGFMCEAVDYTAEQNRARRVHHRAARPARRHPPRASRS